MKLYVLRRLDPARPGECRAFVVRAENSKKARNLASLYRGGEGSGVWVDPNETSCKQLKADGVEEMIVQDYFGCILK